MTIFVRTTAALALAICLSGDTVAVAQQPGGAADDDLGGLLEGLDLGPENEPAVDRPAATKGEPSPASAGEDRAKGSNTAPLVRAFLSMRSARDLLRRGQTGEETQQAQQQAVDVLDSLIRAAEAEQGSSTDGQSSPPNSDPTSTQDATQPGQAQQPSDPGPMAEPSPGGAQGEPRGEQQDGSPAATSAEGGGEGETAVSAGQPIRSALDARGEAVWGHLPQRTRGLLRTEIPTEYLPRYADEISAYFRALAEMPADE